MEMQRNRAGYVDCHRAYPCFHEFIIGEIQIILI